MEMHTPMIRACTLAAALTAGPAMAGPVQDATNCAVYANIGLERQLNRNLSGLLDDLTVAMMNHYKVLAITRGAGWTAAQLRARHAEAAQDLRSMFPGWAQEMDACYDQLLQDLGIH